MYYIGPGCILVYPLVIRHCYGKWPVCFVCDDDFLQKPECIKPQRLSQNGMNSI